MNILAGYRLEVNYSSNSVERSHNLGWAGGNGHGDNEINMECSRLVSRAYKPEYRRGRVRSKAGHKYNMEQCSHGMFEESSGLILNHFQRLRGGDRYGFLACGNHGDYTLGLCHIFELPLALP